RKNSVLRLERSMEAKIKKIQIYHAVFQDVSGWNKEAYLNNEEASKFNWSLSSTLKEG
ncbi:4181_t:CDS:2, partial [Ambispora leptoticha]